MQTLFTGSFNEMVAISMLESSFSGKEGSWCLLEGGALLQELVGAPFNFCMTWALTLQAVPVRSADVLYALPVPFSLDFLLKKAKLSRWGREEDIRTGIQ